MGRRERLIAGIALVVVGAAVGAGVTAMTTDGPASGPEMPHTDTTTPQALTTVLPGTDDATGSVGQFDSDEAFARYVERGQRLAQQGTRFTARRVRFTEDVVRERPVRTAEPDVALEAEADAGAASQRGDDGASAGSEPDRVSNTNVQEAGLDEPDILKTDGQYVYYAPADPRAYRYHREETDESTHVVSIANASDPVVVADVDASGNMLRTGDSLVVFQGDELVGYDVSDPENPEEAWTKPLEDDVVTARLYDGDVYLVTTDSIDLEDPCPIRPMGDDVAVRCTDVFRPDRQAPVDATYTAMSVDPATGQVQDATSFVGTSENTAVYMSENGLYVTYTQQADRGRLRIQFLLEEQSNRLPNWVESRLAEIEGYNISSSAKESEANRVLNRWYRTLPDDEREDVRSDLRNDWRSYLTDNQRELVQTGVVKVGVGDGDLSVETVGTVPGEPLNQFSMDEHDGTLRITTTVPRAGGAQSRNDLYVLDAETMDRRGSVTDMGVNERVYSVRYVEETAYVVTFRRVDPFHVVDLSNPDAPTEVGELELPGFSTYLHPIDDDHVLGIGEESGQVKAVLFDVSDPSNPVVADDYVLDSRWSAIEDSHHAFLLDRDHGVFFLPTGQGGKVIDYTDGSLSLETSVETDGPALRAMYVDDSMYVFGPDEIAVIDETDWTREETVSLD
jgi:uncharacterized secreted protein with C-terminal beta-propeller domain